MQHASANTGSTPSMRFPANVRVEVRNVTSITQCVSYVSKLEFPVVVTLSNLFNLETESKKEHLGVSGRVF